MKMKKRMKIGCIAKAFKSIHCVLKMNVSHFCYIIYTAFTCSYTEEADKHNILAIIMFHFSLVHNIIIIIIIVTDFPMPSPNGGQG